MAFRVTGKAQDKRYFKIRCKLISSREYKVSSEFVSVSKWLPLSGGQFTKKSSHTSREF